MKILLDTSAIIEFLKGNIKVKDVVEKSLDVYTSTLCVYEVFRGALFLEAKGYRSDLNRIREFIGVLNVLDLKVEDVLKASEIWSKLKLQGITINDADVLIFAQAVNRGLTVVTKDRDFARIGEVDAVFI